MSQSEQREVLAPLRGQVGDRASQSEDGSLLQVRKPNDPSGGSRLRGKMKREILCPGSEGYENTEELH